MPIVFTITGAEIRVWSFSDRLYNRPTKSEGDFRLLLYMRDVDWIRNTLQAFNRLKQVVEHTEGRHLQA